MENADINRIRRHIEMYQCSQDTSSILAKQERLKTGSRTYQSTNRYG